MYMRLTNSWVPGLKALTYLWNDSFPSSFTPLSAPGLASSLTAGSLVWTPALSSGEMVNTNARVWDSWASRSAPLANTLASWGAGNSYQSSWLTGKWCRWRTRCVIHLETRRNPRHAWIYRANGWMAHLHLQARRKSFHPSAYAMLWVPRIRTHGFEMCVSQEMLLREIGLRWPSLWWTCKLYKL